MYQVFNTVNFIPPEEIDVLRYSSANPVTVLNNNSSGCSADSVDEEKKRNICKFTVNHDYMTGRIIVYISAFDVSKLTNVLKCANIC